MSRIAYEKEVVEAMVRLYCRGHEGNRELCPECKALLEYAHIRLECCRHGETKPSCKKCATHCYRPEMRERMRMVMRYAGPRMMFRHPIMALRHLF